MKIFSELVKIFSELKSLLATSLIKVRSVKSDSIWKLDSWRGYAVPSVSVYVVVTLLIAAIHITYLLFTRIQHERKRQQGSAASVISGAISSGNYHQTALSLINLMNSTPLIHNRSGTSMFIADDRVAAEVLASTSTAKISAPQGARQNENIPDILTADGDEYAHRFQGFGAAIQALDVSDKDITEPLLLAMSAAADGSKPFDAAEFSTHLALDILCKAAFGHELNAVKGSVDGRVLWGHMHSLLTAPGSRPGFDISGATHTSAAGQNNSVAWDAFLIKMLKVVEATDTTPSSKAPSFSRNLKHWGNALPFPASAKFDEHINTIRSHYMLAEIYQILMHGHLALSSQLMWLFISLHKHTRARGVLDSALSAQGNGPEAVPEYAECWIKEVLRKYPAAGNCTTRSVVDDSCQVAGLSVPKGTALRINIFALQNSSKIWENPQAFLPERFMRGQAKEQFGVQQAAPASCPFYMSPITEHNGGDGSVYSGCGRSDAQLSFLPFSAGARTCLGKNLALKVLRHVLATVSRSFKLDTIANDYNALATASPASEGKEALLAADTLAEDPGKSVQGVILPMHRTNTVLLVSKTNVEWFSTGSGTASSADADATTPIADYQ